MGGEPSGGVRATSARCRIFRPDDDQRQRGDCVGRHLGRIAVLLVLSDDAGYFGRVGVFELFKLDSTIREMCFRGASSVKIREQAKISGGLVSLMDDGVRKFLAGDTTIEEVLTVAVAGDAAA